MPKLGKILNLDKFHNRVKGHGDCYRIAANILIDDMPEDALLCHGTAIGRGVIEGIKHGHAWIELNGSALDFSNGLNVVMSIGRYYEIGKISDVTKYKKVEASINLLKYKHYGPWKDGLIRDD
ncbi:unnamed protein product [marine sediment metagenome]|uniref:Transglutaminase-like domain-containing protein n=1 Tax=marine sediment metagenome TaxID=412755 RepID=X0TJH1_9ZZZZ